MYIKILIVIGVILFVAFRMLVERGKMEEGNPQQSAADLGGDDVATPTPGGSTVSQPMPAKQKNPKVREARQKTEQQKNTDMLGQVANSAIRWFSGWGTKK